MVDQHQLDPEREPYRPDELPLKPTLSVAEWQALDLRIGTIRTVEPFPEARVPAYKLCVDFGPAGILWTSAKVTNYPRRELLGRRVVGVVNLEPKRIAGFRSDFLLLGGLQPDGAVNLLSVDGDLEDGSVVA